MSATSTGNEKPAANTPDFSLPLLAWCSIPAGEVYVELGKWESHYHYIVTEIRSYPVEPFLIARYPVTNAQFDVFITAPDGYADVSWWDFSPPSKFWRTTETQPVPAPIDGEILPRIDVCWYEAAAFCRWLSYKTGLAVTLPTEIQWQRAAQSDPEHRYPWGSTFDATKCNAWESWIGHLTPVDQFSEGASPFGVMDMVGNAWEWCLNTYDDPASTDLMADGKRVVHGGSWNSDQSRVHVLCRRWYYAGGRLARRGFRLACNFP